MVADNQIPLVLIESCGHASPCVDPFKCELVAATAQLPNQQRHVIFRIFDNQYAQRYGQLALLVVGAGSFSINQ